MSDFQRGYFWGCFVMFILGMLAIYFFQDKATICNPVKVSSEITCTYNPENQKYSCEVK